MLACLKSIENFYKVSAADLRFWSCSDLNDMMTSSIRNIFPLLALCEGNSPVSGEIPSHRPVTRTGSFDVFFFYLRLNTRLSKQSRRQWLETPSRSLWRQYSEIIQYQNHSLSNGHQAICLIKYNFRNYCNWWTLFHTVFVTTNTTFILQLQRVIY